MKENNNAKLKVGQIIYTSLAMIFLAIFVTIYSLQNSKIGLAKETQNNETNEIEIAVTDNIENQNEKKDENTIREASTNLTSRFSSTIRESVTEQAEEEKYVSISDVSISKDMDLTVRTGLSKEDFKILIKNTKQDSTKFFYNNSDTIYNLCEKYQINEIFFCGLIAGESGWNIASNHRNTHNYISLMSNGKLLRFSTVEEGLEKAASTLHNKYLSPSGRFYSGKTLAGVKKKFCPASSTWINLIYKCMSQIVK